MDDLSEIGDVVRVTDELGVQHNALVTAVHGPNCINLCYITKDNAKRDPYGNQMERLSSVSKKSEFTASNGRFYETI